MPEYLKQADQKSKNELIKAAITYFWELKNKKKYSSVKAREIVKQQTGVIL